MDWLLSSAVFNLEKMSTHSFLSSSPGSEKESPAKFKSEVKHKGGKRKEERDRDPAMTLLHTLLLSWDSSGSGRGGVLSRKRKAWSQ